jgi:metal-responsive CopG/Arc/MetJ family transcriptional regulator
MPISEQNTRIMVTLSKELAAKLKEQADREKRSVSNMASIIIEEYYEEAKSE